MCLGFQLLIVSAVRNPRAVREGKRPRRHFGSSAVRSAGVVRKGRSPRKHTSAETAREGVAGAAGTVRWGTKKRWELALLRTSLHGLYYGVKEV